MEEYHKILIVDDNKDIHADFQKILTPVREDPQLSRMEQILFADETTPLPEEISYELHHAYQGEEALRKVTETTKTEQPFVLIFMDVRMPPGINGIETIHRIWQQQPLTEMVICSAYSDFSWDEIIRKLGTTDKLLFLKKPFTSLEVKQMTLSLVKKWNLNHKVAQLINNLEAEVKSRTEQLNSLLKELRSKNEKLQEAATRDSLTGLLNQGALYEKLNIVFRQARRHQHSMSLIMLDIDYFKSINDTYGHLTGDQVIIAVAGVLKNSLRLYDIPLRCTVEDTLALKKELEQVNLIGRYGGDEFILIIPHCGAGGVESLAGRIHRAISEIRLKEHPDLKITSSMGVCTSGPEITCDSSTELMKQADRALYQSKENGRNMISYLHCE